MTGTVGERGTAGDEGGGDEGSRRGGTGGLRGGVEGRGGFDGTAHLKGEGRGGEGRGGEGTTVFFYMEKRQQYIYRAIVHLMQPGVAVLVGARINLARSPSRRGTAWVQHGLRASGAGLNGDVSFKFECICTFTLMICPELTRHEIQTKA